METRADPDPALSIPAFFAGKTLLLTGATGFLAKAVLEKILRDLPEVGKVILLVRGKGGADSSDEGAWRRAETGIFGKGLFARLREEKGGDFEWFVREKVACLTGDVRLPDLGLDAERHAGLSAEVDLVINCAATVNFDERLDTALETNVFGVATLLEFARTAGAAFVQVSTAFVCGRRNGRIEEAVLPPDFDFDAEIAGLREIVAELKAAQLPPDVLAGELVRRGMERAKARGWIDTYTYTKFLGEQWLALHRGEVAAVVVRPSIIESAIREPEPGWIEGLRVADPIMIAAGRGLTRFPMSLDTVLDLIPLDFVVNAILAAACRAGKDPGRLEVFTVATGSENPLIQREIIGYVRSCYERSAAAAGTKLGKWRYPPPERFKKRIDWQLRLLAVSGSILGKFSRFKQARRLGRGIRRRQFEVMKIRGYLETYGAYLRLGSCFLTVNSRRLFESLASGDAERFGFDVTSIDWQQYIQEVHLPGLYRNVVGAPLYEAGVARAEGGREPSSELSPLPVGEF
jgi:nucleoside-diphosphate-sugar epimerase